MDDSINREFWTIGEMAAHFGVPRHRVGYVLSTRRIDPAKRLSHCWRLYDRPALEAVGVALAETQANNRRLEGVGA